MEEGVYDAVVCGTGLKECIVSGLLSYHGKRVLHLDRNPYYGGEAASLNLTDLFNKFRPGEQAPKSLGENREWNVDLIPKFVMADGKLVKILLKTRVTKYLEWKSVEGTFVYQYQKAGILTGPKYIFKVPSTPEEALASSMLSMTQKYQCRSFMQFALSYDPQKKETHKDMDPKKTSMDEVFKKFSLQPNTVDYIGHAVALQLNDDYLSKPMGPTMDKITLYLNSISRYGNSPFIYPVYGLGGLPEGFSRMSAIHGGVYMLKKEVDSFEFDSNGKVCGVRSGNEVAKCKMVVCDPSYVTKLKKTKVVGKVIRSICILGAPIPNTNNVTSCQIIIPQNQLNRKHDVYVMMVSYAHCIAAKGKYVAIVSTTVETSKPEEELKEAYALLGKIEYKFTNVCDMFERTDTGVKDQIFVSNSYDALSHFETVSEDVMEMWKNITGQELDLTYVPGPEDEEQ